MAASLEACVTSLLVFRHHVFCSLQVEYERVKEAYVGMTTSLEASASDKRALETRLGQAAADAAREARERRCGPGNPP